MAPKRLKQGFTATVPNQRWVNDITYILTGEGWLYLAVILDLYSRKVVGWCTNSRLQRNQVLDALRMALGPRATNPGLIHSQRSRQSICQPGVPGFAQSSRPSMQHEQSRELL
ncbi:MAG: DDE-type integrase/transposase/recombinase [Nitrospirota bacterium]|nr:DDE-type integrase/transposase/recombinase [Nitrospirota bacterium]